MDVFRELPMGFGMALIKNQSAAQYFESLNEQERRQIIDQTHQISSKQEMQNFVDNLPQGH